MEGGKEGKRGRKIKEGRKGGRGRRTKEAGQEKRNSYEEGMI